MLKKLRKTYYAMVDSRSFVLWTIRFALLNYFLKSRIPKSLLIYVFICFLPIKQIIFQGFNSFFKTFNLSASRKFEIFLFTYTGFFWVIHIFSVRLFIGLFTFSLLIEFFLKKPIHVQNIMYWSFIYNTLLLFIKITYTVTVLEFSLVTGGINSKISSSYS